MGLDMTIYGQQYIPPEFEIDQPLPRLNLQEYELAYWRKHPNLHGFIVKTFADGKDNCQEIRLSTSEIRLIIQAVVENTLPHTAGFFFGSSDNKSAIDDLRQLNLVLKWLEAQPHRSVYYQASW